MEHSPLPVEPDLPGPPVLGFLACAAIVRRKAYLEVGGFDPRMMIGGEEELLAADLASAGWGLAYVGGHRGFGPPPSPLSCVAGGPALQAPEPKLSDQDTAHHGGRDGQESSQDTESCAHHGHGRYHDRRVQRGSLLHDQRR